MVYRRYFLLIILMLVASISLFYMRKYQTTLSADVITKTLKDIPDLDKESFFEQVHKKSKLSILLFYRSECPFCKKFAPIFAKLHKVYQNRVSFFKLNSDLNEEFRKNYVRTHPCLVIFKNGEKQETIQGEEKERTEDKLAMKLDNYLATLSS